MNSPKVSVIVPVYNVAQYLSQCLDSLTAQTLKDLEVILVDDGSTDGSGEILRRYSEREPRFKLVTRANGGYSAARNTGLREVRGEYVGFVDADDWVEPDMFEHLLSLAEDQGADIAQGGFSWYMEQDGRDVPRDNSWIPPLLQRSDGLLRGAEAILFEDIAIWKKIYRRSLFQSGYLTFDEAMPMGEDVPFHLSALCLAHRIAASDRPLYHYRKQRPGQQTAIRDARLLAYFRIFEKMDDLLNKEGLTALLPWMLHLQLSRHCWGFEMAEPEVKDIYFQRLHEVLRNNGKKPIAAGTLRFGHFTTRLRWLALRFLHPLALKAIVNGDRKSFNRLIHLRMAFENPGAEWMKLISGRTFSLGAL